MEKPTAALNMQIIDFFCQNREVKYLLDADDHHNRIFGLEMNCRLDTISRAHPTRSLYIMEFIDEVENSPLEKYDDVSVAEEVS